MSIIKSQSLSLQENEINQTDQETDRCLLMGDPDVSLQYGMSPTTFERICVIIDWKSEKTMGE